MSLVTATAFQQSPAVQTRSFVVLAALAVSEVDDDFFYQILELVCAVSTDGLEDGAVVHAIGIAWSSLVGSDDANRKIESISVRGPSD